jgi:transposase-like protein
MYTKGHCFPKSIIIQAVYLKLHFTLSYRDFEAKYQAEHERVRQWLEENDR